ncbi:MAG TPA: DUF2917 domain-containing protein [Rhizobacter sp.]|nr:DUF2917 domain-containing protein [Rhizobacter sp.]
MTKSQQYGQPAAAVTHWQVPATGELVACAKLWLTRSGDLDDHVLHPGERVRLDRGDDIVIEALRQAPAPLWRWQPAAQPAMGWRDWLPRLAGSAKPVLHPGSCTPA